ncbi:MAG: hypothetical protein WD056_02330 [Gemmatimonadota bacterium]
MPRLALLHARWLLFLMMGLEAVPLAAQQPAGDPIIPRGQFYFELHGSFQTVNDLYASDSDVPRPLGSGFFLPEIGTDQAPFLEPMETRFRALTGEANAPGIQLGATRGRIYGEEQTAELTLSYGALDRLTLAVEVPLVRRRVDALVRHVPEGANLGTNPAGLDPTGVATFQAQSLASTNQLRLAVDDHCEDLGEADAQCVQGRELLAEADGFLGALDAAYAQEPLFPLVDTPLGTLVAARWAAIRTGMGEWDTEGPEELPLATTPISDAGFRELVGGQPWPLDGFPFENTPSYLRLGDVDLQAALALLRPSGGFSDRGGIRVLSTLTGAVRLPTGQPDSLMAIVPLNPPRGVGGVRIGLHTDLLLSSRLAVSTEVEAGWSGSREMDLLAPDPDRVFHPGQARARVLWEPGGHLKLRIAPRVHIRNALSLGVGWQFLRSEADRFEALDASDPSLPAPAGPEQLHQLLLEFRYTALQGSVAEAVRFPFEVLIRGSRTFSGSGDWAPIEQKVEAGVRFLLRR